MYILHFYILVFTAYYIISVHGLRDRSKFPFCTILVVYFIIRLNICLHKFLYIGLIFLMFLGYSHKYMVGEI